MNARALNRSVTKQFRQGIETLFFRFFPFAVFTLRSWLSVVFDVVDTYRSFEYRCAIEVIDRKNGRSLVVIHGETKAPGLPRLLVTRKIDVDNFIISARPVGKE
jgi:hypothetical protein